MPTIVATSLFPAPPPVFQASAMLPAIPCRRSSKIFGSAKVVDWNTMLDIAAVMNTMAETRNSMAFALAEGAGPASAFTGPRLTVAALSVGQRSQA